jgi:hypothetical protein
VRLKKSYASDLGTSDLGTIPSIETTAQKAIASQTKGIKAYKGLARIFCPEDAFNP